MGEFFIALFGSIFLGVKLLSERSEINRFNKDAERLKAVEDKYCEMLKAPDDVVKRLKDYILLAQNAEQIYEELQEDLVFVFGDNYKDIFVLPGSSHIAHDPKFTVYSKLQNSVEWALALLLSKEGYLDWFRLSYGFEIGPKHIAPHTIKLCQRIEHNLKKRNADISLALYAQPKYSGGINWSPYGQRIKLRCTLPAYCMYDERVNLW